jgi:hypothetical protein
MDKTEFDCSCGKWLNNQRFDLQTHNHMKDCAQAHEKFALIATLREAQNHDNFELMVKNNFRLMCFLMISAMEMDEMWFEGKYLKRNFEKAHSQPPS